MDVTFNEQQKMGARLKKIYEQVIFERRVLMFCTVLIGISIIIWCVSIGTDYWFVVDGGKGIYVPATRRYFYMSHSGIWRICRYAFANETTGVTEGFSPGDTGNVTGISETKGKITYFKKCKYHEISANDTKIRLDPSLDRTIMNYNRTEAVFAGITLMLMVLGFIFSCYTFKNPRYMFKRTAGGLHFLSTGSCFTVIEVLINSIEYESRFIPFTYPLGATHTYGYSFVLAWLVFISNLSAGFAFMIFSRKRKGKKAPTEEIAMADEPTIIGR